MKTALCLLLLFLSSPSYLTSQERPVLVVGPVRCTNNIQNPRIQEMTRSAIHAAFVECKHASVQMDHVYRAKTPVEEIGRLKEVEDIIIKNFIQHHGLNELSELDKVRVTQFQKKVKTKYIVFGQIDQNPRDVTKEYSLQLHVVDVDTWTYIIPADILYFSAEAIQGYDQVKSAIVKFIREKGAAAGFCLQDQPSKRMDELDHKVRLMIQTEWLYPWDALTKEQVECYTSKSEAAHTHYLQQKMIVFSNWFYQELERTKGASSVLLQSYAPIIVQAIDALISRTTDQMQKEVLRQKRIFYMKYIQK